MSLLPCYSNPWIELYRCRYTVRNFLERIIPRDINPIEPEPHVVFSLPYVDLSFTIPDTDSSLASIDPIAYAWVPLFEPNPRQDPRYIALLDELSESDIPEERLYRIQKEIMALSNRTLLKHTCTTTIYDALMERAEEALCKYIPKEFAEPLTLDPEEIVNGYNLFEVHPEPIMGYAMFTKFLEPRDQLTIEAFRAKYMCSDWDKSEEFCEESAYDTIMRLPYSQRMLGQAIKYVCRIILDHSIGSINTVCVWVVRKLRQIQAKKIE